MKVDVCLKLFDTNEEDSYKWIEETFNLSQVHVIRISTNNDSQHLYGPWYELRGDVPLNIWIYNHEGHFFLCNSVDNEVSCLMKINNQENCFSDYMEEFFLSSNAIKKKIQDDSLTKFVIPFKTKEDKPYSRLVLTFSPN